MFQTIKRSVWIAVFVSLLLPLRVQAQGSSYLFSKVRITSTATDALTVSGGANFAGNRLHIDPITGDLDDPQGSVVGFGDSLAVVPASQAVNATGLLSLATTWASAGNNFVGIDVNIQGSAFNAASRLLDLRLSNTSVFSVGNQGNVTFAGVLTGNGSGLTNVPLLNAGTNTFTGSIVANGNITTSGAVTVGASTFIQPSSGYMVLNGRSALYIRADTTGVINIGDSTANAINIGSGGGAVTFANSITVGSGVTVGANNVIQAQSGGYLWVRGPTALYLRANSGSTIAIGDDVSSPVTIAQGGGQTTVYNAFKLNAPGSGTGTTLISDASGFVRLNSSSERYKENIRPLGAANLAAFMKIRPIQFDYKSGDKNVLGFSAEALAASGVDGLVNYNVAGQPESIREHALFAYYMLELRHQQDQIDALQRQLKKVK